MRILLWLLCLGPLGALAQATLSAPVISTNPPPFHFTAGSYFHDSNLCHTVTFTITDGPGQYDLQWLPAPPRPQVWQTVYNEADATKQDRENAVNPPIVVHHQPVTIRYAMIPASTDMPVGYWRLKRQ